MTLAKSTNLRIEEYRIRTTHSRILSPVEKMFHTAVPTMYSATATLNTLSQEPGKTKEFIINIQSAS
jgi:hypothetical protein